MTVASEPPSLRIDKWLWHARLAKTRSLAARLCAAGAVSVAGVPARKPHQPIRVGAIVTVPRGRVILTVRVLGLGARRGPAAEARLLYAEHAPPRPVDPVPQPWVSLFAEEGADAED